MKTVITFEVKTKPSKKNLESLQQRIENIIKSAADEAEQYAISDYANARYLGTKDVLVTQRAIENGYEISAKGESVPFLEFGAGIYYNTPDLYPERPSGIVGIGEYGSGHGNRKTWVFYDANGEKHFTHGTKQTMTMYVTGKMLEQGIKEGLKNI